MIHITTWLVMGPVRQIQRALFTAPFRGAYVQCEWAFGMNLYISRHRVANVSL